MGHGMALAFDESDAVWMRAEMGSGLGRKHQFMAGESRRSLVADFAEDGLSGLTSKDPPVSRQRDWGVGRSRTTGPVSRCHSAAHGGPCSAVMPGHLAVSFESVCQVNGEGVIAGNPGFARHPWPSLSLSPRYAMPCQGHKPGGPCHGSGPAGRWAP